MKWMFIVMFILSHDGGSDINIFRFYTEIGCIKARQYIKKGIFGKENPHRGGLAIISDCFEEK